MDNPRENATVDVYFAASAGAGSVLIAEPEGVIRMALMSELYAAGLVPVAVATAAAASTAACSGTFEAVVAECVFGGDPPGSAIAEIHRCRPNLPIICTTSFEYRDLALGAGSIAVVEKPYLYSYLLRCVTAHIP